MANLTYLAIASLDGYVEDGKEIRTGRRRMRRCTLSSTTSRALGHPPVRAADVRDDGLVETGDHAAVYRDYAEIWRAAEKVVYSRTLHTVSSERTRIEREFDAAAIRRLKQSSRI